MRNLFGWSSALVFVFTVAATTVACAANDGTFSNAGASSSDCAPGQACGCSGAGSCQKTCTGKNCQITCDGPGSCNVSCPQGGCTVTNTGAGSANVGCGGGGCTLQCQGAGSCNIGDCAGGGCTCNKLGAGTCND
jgi:hypothetical protein